MSLENKLVLACRMANMSNLEIAHLLAQVDHESQGFTRLEEGTKYRYSTAKRVFSSKYHAAINALQYENKAKDNDFIPQPQFFNLVYGGRMGNDWNGDGYEYRGRGLIQLTGKQNYIEFRNYSGIDVVNNPNLMIEDDASIKCVLWFWKSRNCAQYAIQDDIEKVTKLINGGLIGLEDRKKLLAKYKKMFDISL